ncbi:hypothetical protein Tco_0624631 [Tanacetum coccineum]|uniref:Uncharacterized protein n=1 Tax=Tanacetum coccineum TaxID=301880 RepID=A0ABQ4WEN4_9ASTR
MMVKIQALSKTDSRTDVPTFKKEAIMFVEDESCPIYDTDNEEEESMPVYDTDIEDVIEEEEGFLEKGGLVEKEAAKKTL